MEGVLVFFLFLRYYITYEELKLIFLVAFIKLDILLLLTYEELKHGNIWQRIPGRYWLLHYL
ncbi:MAG: hypothetical protein PWR24_1413 [Desulfonauticus sp.]|nr:hypothetical protein [Desulfonauticus sp.]